MSLEPTKGNKERSIGVKVKHTRQHISDNINVAAGTRKFSEYILKSEAISSHLSIVKFISRANIGDMLVNSFMDC